MSKLKASAKEAVEHIKDLKLEGLPNIFLAENRPHSLFWTAFFIVCSILCGLVLADLTRQYMHWEVSSTIRFKTETTSNFPVVSFCNLNPFTTEYAYNLALQAGLQFTEQNSTLDYWQTFLKMNDYLNSTRGHGFTEEEKAKLSDFGSIVDCQFGDGQPCDWDHIFHPTYFNCYRFNPKGLRSASRTNFDYMLSVVLFAGPTNPLVQETDLKGYYVMIQNHTDYPLGPDRKANVITTGLAASCAPDRTFYNQYMYPYSECTVTSEMELVHALADESFFNAIIETGSFYSQPSCYSVCTQHLINTLCGCNTYQIGYKTPGFLACSYEEEIQCVSRDFYGSNESAILVTNRCGPNCPIECSRVSFDVTISYYVYPTAHLDNFRARFNKSDWSADDYNAWTRDNLVEVSVFYANLAYMESVDDPIMTDVKFLALVGGHLHFFLGMSLITIVEMIELFIVVIIRSLSSTVHETAQEDSNQRESSASTRQGSGKSQRASIALEQVKGHVNDQVIEERDVGQSHTNANGLAIIA